MQQPEMLIQWLGPLQVIGYCEISDLPFWINAYDVNHIRVQNSHCFAPEPLGGLTILLSLVE
uniref:Uncharacterized protein n=1 Tax=Ralstonia solanacearum TaxID=305 RepID=A0A0S4TZ20_RALSL|nr:protein of unknown function [Ralstonia solanacearum]